MHFPTCRVCSNLLLVASLAAASGAAFAFDDSIDLGKVSAAPRPTSQGFDMPVSADMLLATTSGALSPGLPIVYAGVPPVATRAESTSLAAAAAGVPVRMTLAPMSGNAAPGLHATVSITLTSTTMSDAAGNASALPTVSGIVSVGYSVK